MVRHLLRLIVLASLIGVAGCATKATYVSRGNGTYVLQTGTDSLDEAMTRFQRTAAELCPSGNYAFGEPADDHTTTPTTYDVEMTCTPP
jgi:hypothetical protein